MSFKIDQLAVYNLATVGDSITAGSFVKSGGTASQFLKADGSVDGSTYLTTAGTAANSSALNGISVSQIFNNMGDNHGTRGSFDASTASYGFGFRFVQGATNGPGTSGSQYYSWYIGLGNEYPATGNGSYGAMFAIDRDVATPYLSVRYNESNSFGTWRKVAAGYADSAGSVAWTNVSGRPTNVSSFTNDSGYLTTAANWFGSITTGGVTDWNDVTNTRPGTGYTLLQGNHTNGPLASSEYFHPFNIEYSSKDGTGNVTQFAISYGSPGDKMYMRGRYDSSWSSWIAFLTSSNFNSYSPTLTGTGASGTWGINITGAANNASLLTASGASLTAQAGSGTVRYDYAIANNTTGLFTGSDNSNSILTLNRHPADYYSQLGFSSNGWLYYRSFSATAINTSLGWRQLLDSSNYTSYALSIGGGTISSAGDQGLTINKSSGTSWNYIGFSVAGVRKAYFGIDANGYATIGSDVGQIAFAHATSAPSLTVSGALTVNVLNTGDVIDLGYTRNGSIATTAFRGINFHSTEDFNYYIGKPSGTWTQPLHIHFWSGIRLRTNQANGGTQFYNIGTSVTVATVNDGDNNFRGYYDVIAYASDRRLKENVKPIENALDKINKLTGMTYTWNDVGRQHGWDPGKEREAGVFAQDVQEVLPEAVRIAPFDNDKGASKSGENFLTVKYEKLVPLLIEAIKEQQSQIEQLKDQVNQLKENN